MWCVIESAPLPRYWTVSWSNVWLCTHLLAHRAPFCCPFEFSTSQQFHVINQSIYIHMTAQCNQSINYSVTHSINQSISPLTYTWQLHLINQSTNIHVTVQCNPSIPSHTCDSWMNQSIPSHTCDSSMKSINPLTYMLQFNEINQSTYTHVTVQCNQSISSHTCDSSMNQSIPSHTCDSSMKSINTLTYWLI